MQSTPKDVPIIVFGSSGFVGRSLVKNANRTIIETIRSGNSWKLVVPHSESVITEAFVVIAAGSSRFASKHSINFDLEIVTNISKTLRTLRIKPIRVIYISTLAAKFADSRNLYGSSKVKAENYLLQSFPETTIWRPPALFGQGMSSQSHLNWLLHKRVIFYFFSKITNSAISLLHVDDFSKEVLANLQHYGKNQFNQKIIYPGSLAIKFKDLAPRLVEKKSKPISTVDCSKSAKIWNLLPFKLQPFFRPIWADDVNNIKGNQGWNIRRLENHIQRFKGRPTFDAPVIVIGAGGGLGSSVCRLLESNHVYFIGVDLKFPVENLDWKYCQDYWRIDLTKDKDLARLYKRLDAINDVSWILTVAGVGLRRDINEVNRLDRLLFWKLMVLSRLDIVAWAQTRSLSQEHIGVINVSSSSSYFPLPKYVDYSIANASVRLVSKVANYNFPRLSVKTVVPGGMKTNLMVKFGDLEKFHAGSMAPTYVAEHILRMIVKKTKEEVAVGLNAKVLRMLYWQPFGGVTQNIINRVSERLR